MIICTPDKASLNVCAAHRVVQLDRRRRIERNEAGVIARFGVAPKSIPAYLALVGDAADGYPGLPGWGAKSTAALVGMYGHIESIPSQAIDPRVGGECTPGTRSCSSRALRPCLAIREIATLRTDVLVFDSVEELRWRCPTSAFEEIGTLPDPAVSENPAESAGRGSIRRLAAAKTLRQGDGLIGRWTTWGE